LRRHKILVEATASSSAPESKPTERTSLTINREDAHDENAFAVDTLSTSRASPIDSRDSRRPRDVRCGAGVDWRSGAGDGRVKTSYGLDLAGYSSGRSSLAKATFEEGAGFSVVVYRGHAFAHRLKGRDPIVPLAERESQLLARCRPLYVDVPIDLQRLPNPHPVYFTWQLTRRPVDRAFNALPPLADRLGSPVARLAHLLGEDRDALGKWLFETYPAACLKLLLRLRPSYKLQTAERQAGEWIGDDGLVDILRSLRVTAEDGAVVNDDDLDAIVCALCGVLPNESLLQGQALEEEIRRGLEVKTRPQDRDHLVTAGPKGYVLIRSLPKNVSLQLSFENTPYASDEARV